MQIILQLNSGKIIVHVSINNTKIINYQTSISKNTFHNRNMWIKLMFMSLMRSKV